MDLPPEGDVGYPPAERLDLYEDFHGVRVHDAYRWLEEANAPATLRWRDAQQQLFAAERARWPAGGHFGEALRELLPERLEMGAVTRGRREFFWRLERHREHPVLMVNEEGTERVLADPAALDATGNLSITAWHPSLEGDRLALQFVRGGSENAVLCVIDVATGAAIDGPLGGMRHSGVAWAPGGAAFYYVGRPPARSGASSPGGRVVLRHTVGSAQSTDTAVMPSSARATGPYTVADTVDGRWLVITSGDRDDPDTRQVWFADMPPSHGSAPGSEEHREAGALVLRPLSLSPSARSGVRAVRDGRIYAITTDGAPRGRICVTDVRTADEGPWRELVAESPDSTLEDFVVLDGTDGQSDPAPTLLVVRRHSGVARIAVHRLDDGAHLRDVALPGDGDVRNLRAIARTSAALEYSDHGSSVRALRHNAGRPGLSLLRPHTTKVTSNPEVETRQIVYPSLDGTLVPLRIVSRRGLLTPAPTILSVYGGFGVTQAPEYAPGIRAWVEAGGVFAIAGVRGGGEEGSAWHEAGKREKKPLTFDDTIAAAEYLVSEGRCTRTQLGLHGASNGGLTVGATIVRRPELFRAAVCSAPLLDMVRYEQLGIGASWRSEYGSASVPEEFGQLLSFSPYHGVVPGTAYPAVMFSVFTADDRVDPAHARKMCAALQHATSSPPSRKIALREEGLGHGLRPLASELAHTADMLAFFASELGLTT
ncbi:prolyl oligopeptidase family serine peptidase [Streptomyces sp. NPDC056402]|uniref:prolyl oligopeptidase family serine peptidase n=1 Tax=Streptomyces sp. NPDC056402 TaxID=3345810 RepID=UPI0035E2C06A